MENGTDSEHTVNSVSAADRAIGVPRVGVGVVVLNNQDHVLIGKRKSPHGQGTLSVKYTLLTQEHGHYRGYFLSNPELIAGTS
jgi:hypothetical protein